MLTVAKLSEINYKRKKIKYDKNNIDSLDFKILDKLNTNSKNSIRQIGRDLGENKSKVSYRLKRLEDKEIIAIRPSVNLKQLKLHQALLFIQINDPDTEKRLVEHWQNCPFVLNYYPLLGWRYSLALVLIAPKTDDFNIFINECEALNKDDIVRHSLIQVIDQEIPNTFSFSSLKSFKSNNCKCKGCNKVWNKFFIHD